jgi:AAT family amino acid transporter
MLAAILITMGLDADYRMSWEVGVPWMVLISAAYFLWARVHKNDAKLSSAT